jgi:hypothetical protein
MRILFKSGKQREFIKEILSEIGCPSLRRLGERGIDVNYQSLKSYYHEDRTLPEDLFQDLCKLSGLNPASLKIKKLNDNWGRVKGGKR